MLWIATVCAPGFTQVLPPAGERQIQVLPRVFSAGEVLRPGIYNVWIRIREHTPDANAGRVAVDRGGTWTRYTNVDFRRGGQPRHVTVFPDMIHDGTINFKDLNDPRYGKPGAREFILHIDNRSMKDTVTYVFQRMSTGSAGTPPAADLKQTPFVGLWHTRRMHSGCCSYAADADINISTGANGVTTCSSKVFPGVGKVNGNTFSYSYGPGCTVTFTLSEDGRSFTGTFSDNNHHRGTVQGRR